MSYSYCLTHADAHSKVRKYIQQLIEDHQNGRNDQSDFTLKYTQLIKLPSSLFFFVSFNKRFKLTSHVSSSIRAVILGIASIPVTVYVPVLNTQVFYQGPIDWEWGVVFGMTILFVVLAELWKALVRSKEWYAQIGGGSFVKPGKELEGQGLPERAEKAV